MQCSNALTVQAEILRERLCNAHLHRAAAKEMSHGPCIGIYIACSKPLTTDVRKYGPRLREFDLLRRIKEGKQLFPFAEVCNTFPLSF